MVSPGAELNLNIGAGKSRLAGFVSLDFASDWYGADRDGIVEYDVRTDSLPFDAGSASNIYCSHMIEHIETAWARRLFADAFRVLRPGGVFRIACPDVELLWAVSSFENDYWTWRRRWFLGRSSTCQDLAEVRRSDFFVREVATPLCRFYTFKRVDRDYSDEMFALPYKEAVESLCSGLTFDPALPGDHINPWDFERVRAFGRDAGFRNIVRSKAGGSVSRTMRGAEFDTTHPLMSLYVDLVK